jgi:hypothetical protein
VGWQPVALVGFCATSGAKIPIIGHAWQICHGSLQGKIAS